MVHDGKGLDSPVDHPLVRPYLYLRHLPHPPVLIVPSGVNPHTRHVPSVLSGVRPGKCHCVSCTLVSLPGSTLTGAISAAAPQRHSPANGNQAPIAVPRQQHAPANSSQPLKATSRQREQAAGHSPANASRPPPCSAGNGRPLPMSLFWVDPRCAIRPFCPFWGQARSVPLRQLHVCCWTFPLWHFRGLTPGMPLLSLLGSGPECAVAPVACLLLDPPLVALSRVDPRCALSRVDPRYATLWHFRGLTPGMPPCGTFEG